MGLYQSLNKEQKQILEQWIAFFGFSPIRYLSLSAVSTGEQRLALLARAFVKSPPLLVLDEPCQHLDEQHTQQVIQLVDAICSQTNTTLIYVSHYADEVPSSITNVFELTNGLQNIYKKEEIKAA